MNMSERATVNVEEDFIKTTDHRPTDHRPANQTTHRPFTTYPPTH